MLAVSGILIPEQGLGSLQTIKTIVGLATPELGLVQVDLLTIPIRVETRHQTWTMQLKPLIIKPWATFLSAKSSDKRSNFSFF